MAQLIDPSRITVVKDTDNTSQTKLDKLFQNGTDSDYYYSSSSSAPSSKTVTVYFKLDKGIYLSSIACASPKNISYPVNTVTVYGYKDETFSGATTICSFSFNDKTGEFKEYTVAKDKIKKYQYFGLYMYRQGDSSINRNSVNCRMKQVKLYGEDSMPKYIMKNVDGDYFYTQDNSIVTVRKEDIIEDMLMDDVNTVTKENLELVKEKFKVLRILVP